MNVWIMHKCIYESGVLITKTTARRALLTPNPAPTMSFWVTLGDDLSKPRTNTG